MESGPADPQLSGRWLYWQSTFGPLYAYDVTTRQLFTVVTPGDNENIIAAAFSDTIAAWCRNLDWSHSAPHDSVLEWRTIP